MLETWLVWPDCHIPFEDKRAFNLVLKVARALKPYGQAVIGDFGDMLSVSSHDRTPSEQRWQLKDEVDAVNKRLDQLDEIGSKRKVFCTGNHDFRGQRLAMRQAIGLYDSLDPAHLFKLKERGWEVYPYQTPVRIGKVWLVHDTGFSGVDAARKNGDVFQASTVQGHTHAAQVSYFGNVLGEQHVSATIGWLGDSKAAKYMADAKRTRNWVHAFAIMRIEPNKNTHVQVVAIVDGRCVVDGKLFTC